MTYKKWNKLGIVSQKDLPAKISYRLIRPDGDDGPLYLVSKNYEKLLHWNRSLRFAISIGTFADNLTYD